MCFLLGNVCELLVKRSRRPQWRKNLASEKKEIHQIDREGKGKSTELKFHGLNNTYRIL